MDMEINFPNLGIYLDHVGKNISIFGFSIAYYGIVIVTGMMIAIWIAQREAKRTGQNPEQYLDLAMIGIAAGILGARIYYVIFAWDYYKDDLLSIFNIRQGGLAIYGGIIGACIAVVIYSRKKKQNFSLLMDTASMSIVFGQIMGRWGNFFNREAFGDYTNNLFAMQLPVSAVRANEITQKMWDHVVTVNGVEYIQVHPTFLYESLWNVGVLLFLFWFRKRKKFNGEVFLMYLIGYGLGRIWIEGLRTDQLLLPVDFRFPSSFRGALWWDVPSWWYGNEKNYHPVGRQPILKDKTSEKNRIKIQKKGKPAKKVFSFLIQNWYKKGGKCA